MLSLIVYLKFYQCLYLLYSFCICICIYNCIFIRPGRGHWVQHHPEGGQGEGGAGHRHDVLALVQLEELCKGLLHLLHQQLLVLLCPRLTPEPWT